MIVNRTDLFLEAQGFKCGQIDYALVVQAYNECGCTSATHVHASN